MGSQHLFCRLFELCATLQVHVLCPVHSSLPSMQEDLLTTELCQPERGAVLQAMAWSAFNGVGLAFVLPCAQSLVADYYAPSVRGRAFGFMFTMAALGARAATFLLCRPNRCSVCAIQKPSPGSPSRVDPPDGLRVVRSEV